MTFQYFIGAIIVMFVLDFCVVALIDGVVGMFLGITGDKWIRVVVKNDGFNH
jgi:hypothetical protein